MEKQSGKKVNKPAKFIKILYSLFQISDSFLQWNQNQESFRITNIPHFIQKILPKFFRHKNITSFIRQLNLYGFKKLTDEGSLENSYSHPNFKKGRTKLLCKIQRKNLHKKKPTVKNQVKVEQDAEEQRNAKKQIQISILQCQNQLKLLQSQNIRLIQQQKQLRQFAANLWIQNQNFHNNFLPAYNLYPYHNFSNFFNHYQNQNACSANSFCINQNKQSTDNSNSLIRQQNRQQSASKSSKNQKQK